MQSQYKYNIKNNNNVKSLLVHIRKMQNVAKSEIIIINKIVLLTKAMINRKNQILRLEK